MSENLRIAFRPMAREDLPNLQRWLADPEVSQWWRETDLGFEALATRYGPIIDGSEPTRGYVFALGNVEAGYIQAYRIADHPAYARQIDVEGDSVGIDLFIGEPALRGKGHAGPLLQAFLRRVVFGEMQAEVAVIAPEPANLRAIHVYERVGFVWRKTVSVVDENDPLNSGDEFVMTLPRASFDMC